MSQPLHARTHPSLNIEGCFGCKAAGIRMSADAMPFRKAHAHSSNVADQQLAVDGPAYRRLRKEGLQPKSFRGAAELEARARTRDEVTVGRRLPGDGNLRPDLIPQ